MSSPKQTPVLPGKLTTRSWESIARLSVTSPQQLENYRQTFNLFDTDKNGAIDLTELGNMVAKLEGKNPSIGELQNLMREVDINGDGKIDFPEFVYLMTRMSEDTDQQEEEIKSVFKRFDLNQDGVIDKKELAKMFTKLGIPLKDREIDDVMQLLDNDKDGVINFEEFKEAYIKFSLKSQMPEFTEI